MGEEGGVVRIWDVERGRCIADLHAPKCGLEGAPWFTQIEIARDIGRVVAVDRNHGLLHVWNISKEGEQERYERVHFDGDRGDQRGRATHAAFAAAALLGDSRPLEECTNAVTRFRPRSKDMGAGLDAVLVSSESDLIREKGNSVKSALVQGCDSGALVVAVNRVSEAITVLSAVTDKVLRESPPRSRQMKASGGLWCVAASQVVDGRVLVATGHRDQMVRVREADTGAVIGEWQAPTRVYQVRLIDGADRRGMGLCDDGGLRVWSLETVRSAGDESSSGQDCRETAVPGKARPQHRKRNRGSRCHRMEGRLPLVIGPWSPCGMPRREESFASSNSMSQWSGRDHKQSPFPTMPIGHFSWAPSLERRGARS